MAFGFGEDKKKDVLKEKEAVAKPMADEDEKLADQEALMNEANVSDNEDAGEMMIRKMIEEASAVLGEEADMFSSAVFSEESAEMITQEETINNEAEDEAGDEPEDTAEEENNGSKLADYDENRLGSEKEAADYLEELARLSEELNQESMPEHEVKNSSKHAALDDARETHQEETEEIIQNTVEQKSSWQSTDQEMKGLFVVPEEKTEEKIQSQPDGEEVSVILPGIIIEGNITAPTALNIRGEIRGNVSCKDKLQISGKIIGDVQGETVVMERSKVKGNVVCDQALTIHEGSAVAGNIKTASVVIAGIVKGDVEATESADIAETAVIVGNVTSESIQIARGAVLEGTCSQHYNVENLNEYLDM